MPNNLQSMFSFLLNLGVEDAHKCHTWSTAKAHFMGQTHGCYDTLTGDGEKKILNEIKGPAVRQKT